MLFFKIIATGSNYFISFNTETMRQISSSYPISSMCRFRFAVDGTEMRILFLKAGGQSLHRNVRFFPSSWPCHKTRLNDHTTPPCCFVASMLFFPLHMKACLRCVLARFSPGRLYRNLALYWTKLNWESVPFTGTRMQRWKVTKYIYSRYCIE